jgi:hypothetical protein
MQLLNGIKKLIEANKISIGNGFMKKSQEQLTRINAPNGLARNLGCKSRLLVIEFNRKVSGIARPEH